MFWYQKMKIPPQIGFVFMLHRLLLTVSLVVSIGISESLAQYDAWKYSGTMYIVTTPDGADLPEAAVERDFPLLVRLNRGFFDFSQARPRGEDIRFSADGQPLAYQIESWNVSAGHADIWVRIPIIQGNTQQAIQMHWGNEAVASKSNGEEVFVTSRGFAGVWHLGDDLHDSTSNNLDGVNRTDRPTTNSTGVIGDAQEFGIDKLLVIRPPDAGQDRRVKCMPAGNADRTMSAWVKPTSFESHNWAPAAIGGWGEPEPGQKPGMGLSYFTLSGRGQPRFHLYGFDPRCASALPRHEWRHVALSISDDMVRFYVDGVQEQTIDNNSNAVSRLGTLRTPASTRVDLGDHGNGRGPFSGVLDEVRFESVARSDHWLKLCFENQKPLQRLVGPLVKEGHSFSVSQSQLELNEGSSIDLSAEAEGARKIYWVLQDGDAEEILAIDCFDFTFNVGRVTGNKTVALQVKAVFESGVKTQTIPIAIQDSIPDPAFTLKVPPAWNGRDALEISPTVINLTEMKSNGAGDLNYVWEISGMATISESGSGKLILKRAQNSGTLTINLALDNGGDVITQSARIPVAEPQSDPWVTRNAASDEKPVDHQFYARDDRGQGTLHCNGTLRQSADSVFLKLYADGKLVDTQRQEINAGKTYALSTKLRAGLISYRTEFGINRDGLETVLETANDLVCGDVFVIQGQSNAEAWTDERIVHPYRSSWLRSFGTPSTNRERARDSVWGNAISFNGGKSHHHLQIGYWGVELGKMLIEKHKVPVCIINGAQGGTRVDQHQRNESDPTDVTTIYGRLLWRLREAKLTHGVRAILWHQGENDQGESGATGNFGWVNYQDYFIRMAAAWKQDYPNIKHYYVHQIWPGACGSRSIEGDRLRERQRQLPRQFSNMSILSTLGIRPGGGCHYLPEGYAAMARQLFPLINQHNYGMEPTLPADAPNLESVSFSNGRKNEIEIVFDQKVKWDEQVAGRFYLDGVPAKGATLRGTGNGITLKLAGPTTAQTLTYIKGGTWKQDDAIIRGENDIAALTFCEVPIDSASE